MSHDAGSLPTELPGAFGGLVALIYFLKSVVSLGCICMTGLIRER